MELPPETAPCIPPSIAPTPGDALTGGQPHFQRQLIREMQLIMEQHCGRQEEQLQQLRVQLRQDFKDALVDRKAVQPADQRPGDQLFDEAVRTPSELLGTGASDEEANLETGPSNMSLQSRLWSKDENIRNSSKATIDQEPSSMLGRLYYHSSILTTWIRRQLTVPPSFEKRHRNRSAVGRFVNSWTFILMTGTLIISNAVYVGAYADFTVKNELRRIDGASYEERWWIFHTVFNFMFLLEIAFRIAADGFDFFFGKDAVWNWFDMFLCVLPVVDLLEENEYVPNLSYLRILRCFRLIHTFEIFRLPVFAHLRIMTNGMLRSLPSVIWAVVFASLFMYMSGVGFCLGFANELQKLDKVEDMGRVNAMRLYFSNLPESVKHLFMAITNGIDWIDIYGPLSQCGPWFELGYFCFLIFMNLAVLNIISGMFIERAFKVIKEDRDFWILEETRQKLKYQDRVSGLFHEMDKDMSGNVSWEEFSRAVRNPHVAAYLSFIDLDTAHLHDIFQVLDVDHNGDIDIGELFQGLDEMRGPAKRVDVLRMHQLLHELIGRMPPSPAQASSPAATNGQPAQEPS